MIKDHKSVATLPEEARAIVARFEQRHNPRPVRDAESEAGLDPATTHALFARYAVALANAHRHATADDFEQYNEAALRKRTSLIKALAKRLAPAADADEAPMPVDFDRPTAAEQKAINEWEARDEARATGAEVPIPPEYLEQAETVVNEFAEAMGDVSFTSRSGGSGRSNKGGGSSGGPRRRR